MQYGATSSEWALFDTVLGLTSDLLPVVSNPNAVISPNSKMKALGKTPSLYNRQRQAAGMVNWTSKQTTAAEVQKWMAEPDYGICLQTRSVRALDIDVEDKEAARAIGDFIIDRVGSLPVRCRANSPKCLIAFRLPGDMPKRVIKVDGGIIEFLATGQQFIACGTHSSGARYEWAGGLPDDFPELTLEQFESLWSALVEQFAIETPSEGKLRRRGETIEGVHDDVVDKLDVLSWGKDGQAFITCPWFSNHSMDSGESQTAYFPAGTNGYEQGHFACRHAGCANRSDNDFLDALGLGVINDFDDLPAVCDGEGGALAEREMPALARNKAGEILATVGNLEAVLMREDICGEYIRFDNFRDEIMYAPVEDAGQWRAFTDVDYTRLRIHLERNNFKAIAKEMIRDVVHRVADLRHFDTAIAWLGGLTWDGVPRVENFLRDYFGAGDDAYTRSVSLYMWTAMAGRVMQPGVKADMVPVLVGQQGVGKSYGVAELAPSFEFCETIDLMDRDADLARRMRGKIIIEFGELRGLHGRDMEGIKEFITRTYESWVPKYQEFAKKYPRRCVFIGTTNQEEFLADTTGNRRWLPVRCGKVNVDGIRNDRLQLWAEARELFELLGVMWSSAQELAADVHSEHRVTDVWVEAIQQYLETPDIDGVSPATRNNLRVSEILQHALGFDLRQIKRGDEMRVAASLRELGFVRKNLRVEGKTGWFWVK